MQLTTIEGVVRNGKIQLSEDVSLPENTQVYVVLPNSQQSTGRIISPRLVDKSKIKDFEREIIDIADDEI